MAVADWSTTAADNTTVGPVNIAEGCPAGNMNNMGREMMAQIAAWRDGLGTSYQAKDATLTAIAGLTTAADQIPYATGADTFAMTALSAFMRSALGAADSATAGQALGVPTISALSLGAPGYVRFRLGASTFLQIAWGTGTAPGAGSTGISYAAPFPSASFPIVSGANGSTSNDRNLPAVVGGSASASGFSVFNSSPGAVSFYYIAVGY